MVYAPLRLIIPSLKLGIIFPYRRTNHALSLTCLIIKFGLNLSIGLREVMQLIMVYFKRKAPAVLRMRPVSPKQNQWVKIDVKLLD